MVLTPWGSPCVKCVGAQKDIKLTRMQASQRRQQGIRNGEAPAKTYEELETGANRSRWSEGPGSEAGPPGFQWERLERVLCPMFSGSRRLI